MVWSSVTCTPTTFLPLIENIQTEDKSLSVDALNLNTPERTESFIDKLFEIENDLSSETTLPSFQYQIPTTTDIPAKTTEIPNEHSVKRAYETYQEILQNQIYRTFFMLLTEFQKRQLDPQQAQESQIFEASVPLLASSSTNDDNKVIVFDVNTNKYVLIDSQLLEHPNKYQEKTSDKSKQKKSKKNDKATVYSGKIRKNSDIKEPCVSCSIDGIESMLYF